MTIYKKQPRDLKTTSTATAAESAARTSAGLDELFSASARTATVQRVTGETDITLTLTLDGTGSCDINTGVPFFDHMLNAFGRHGLFDLKVEALGDTEVDAHHTVEDTGIVLGRAFAQALALRRCCHPDGRDARHGGSRYLWPWPGVLRPSASHRARGHV